MMSRSRKKQVRKSPVKPPEKGALEEAPFGTKLRAAIRRATKSSLRFCYFGVQRIKKNIVKNAKYCARYACTWFINVFDFKNEPVPLPKRANDIAMPDNVYYWSAAGVAQASSGGYGATMIAPHPAYGAAGYGSAGFGPVQRGQEYETTIDALRRALRTVAGSRAMKVAVRGLRKGLAFMAKLTLRVLTGVKMRDITLSPTPETRRSYLTSFGGRLVTVGAPAGALLALALVIMAAAEFTVGVKVTIDGEDIAIIRKQDDFDSIVDEVEHYISSITGEPYALGVTPEFSLALVEKDAVGAGEEALYSQLMHMTDGAYVDGYALYINNAMLGVNTNGEAIQKILDGILAQYVSDDPDERIDFVQDVEIRPGRYNSRDVASLASIETLLYSTTQQEKLYVIQKDDMFSTIAPKLNMSTDELYALNPDVDPTKLGEGMEIKVQNSVPLLSVQTLRKIQYTEELPYDVIKEETDKEYTNYKKTTQEGEIGEEMVTAEIVMVDGIETERVILARDVIKEPVDQVILVGTKKMPAKAPTGSLRRPYGGIITSRFGARGGTHTGVDLAGPTGGAIVAADGGTVIFSGRQGSYGLLVKIDHGNGMTTYYAHCSKLYVSVGEKVAKGQTIAAVGSTGNSTGPHVHFEVRINNVPKNPLNYTG